jgi:hypothetical protein
MSDIADIKADVDAHLREQASSTDEEEALR